MTIRLTLAAIALTLAAPAAAAPDRLAETLALPVASGLTGAQDVARFAWIENAAGARNVWVADKGRPARQVTAFAEDDGQQIYDLNLSPDGATLVFVRGGDGEFPDDGLPNTGLATATPKQQLFAMPATGGAAVAIGEGHQPVFSPDGGRIAFVRKGQLWLWQQGGEARKLASVEGGIERLGWSPDGTRLLFVEARSGHSFVALFDVTGQRLTYLDPSLGHSVEPAFSPDGRQVAFIRYVDPPSGAKDDSGPYWSIRITDVASGETRELWAAPQGMGARFAGTRSRNLFWSKDDTLVFPWERSGWLHAYAIDANKGGAPRELTPGAFEVETMLLDRDGRALLYSSNAGDLDRRHIRRTTLASGATTRLSGGTGIESYPAPAGDTIGVIASDATHPAHPALLDAKLTPIGKAPAAQDFVAPNPVIFRAADGVEVHAQLFRAKGPGRHPALIFVHGGPRRQMLLGFHPSGYYSNAYILNQHLAAEGYDVLAVNYRSGTGYGLAFRDAPEIARAGASEYRDVLAAGKWLAAQAHVDPARIGIWGGSWGGYLTALALARDSALFAAGVDFHGVHTMLRPVENNLSPDQQTAARQLQWTSSPMGAIDTWRSPVLLIHGDDDQNVDFSQSLILARELAARRIPYREIAFPNERHGFFRYADWLKSYRATEAFFRTTLIERKPLK
ncbi:prolyl oligopeptidase family serine peptidase [Sphingomonas naphthae]|uniref:Acyl-peptide hydrolase n=1 Tax=Sphingomonas naphthae TaxID=1813468 RepID=A0ABY7TNG3_9SPHN|nr:alpha/beta fold hydrolase [Sphingomonas naphthae]WCT74778.1 prolyl oligopeptidase family serine peptidase [Sphingomonas naphthae]